MNLLQVPIASVSAPALLVLGWPEEDGGPPVAEASVMCLMRRQEGLLLAVPSHFFDEELLQAAQVAPPSEVLGRSEFFECSAAILTDEGLVEHGSRISVLVVDCSEDVCASLALAEDALALTAEAFQPEDPSLVPFVPSLQKAKVKAKAQTATQRKMSAAVLAERLETALSALPALNSRLDELAERQARLEGTGLSPNRQAKLPLRSHLGFPAPSAALPPTQAAAASVGPPPKTRSQLLHQVPMGSN